MPAGNYDITIEQGATWYRPFQWFEADGTTPIPVAGYLARMMIRHSYGDPSPQVSLDSDTIGGIVLSAPNHIDVTITAVQTAAMTAKNGVWDLELVAPDGTVKRFLKGTMTLDLEATK